MKPSDRKNLFIVLGIISSLVFVLLLVLVNITVFQATKEFASTIDETPEDSYEATVSGSETQPDNSAITSGQTVGSEKFGYVTIPGSWVKFTDVEDNTDLQYSNPEGTSIITLNVVSLDDIWEEESYDVTLDSIAESIYYNLQNNDVFDLQTSDTSFGPYNAVQIEGSFISEDYSLDSSLVCWIFQSSDGVYHFTAAEAALEDFDEVASYVKDSYTLAPPVV